MDGIGQFRGGQAVDEIHLNQCRLAADGDGIVKFFKPADGARDGDDFNTFRSKGEPAARPRPRDAPVTGATRSVICR